MQAATASVLLQWLIELSRLDKPLLNVSCVESSITKEMKEINVFTCRQVSQKMSTTFGVRTSYGPNDSKERDAPVN